jgi:hypothetical protein
MEKRPTLARYFFLYVEQKHHITLQTFRTDFHTFISDPENKKDFGEWTPKRSLKQNQIEMLNKQFLDDE